MNEFEFRYPLLFRVGEKDACAVVRARIGPFEDANQKQRDASDFGHRLAAALNAQSDAVRGDEVMSKLAENTVGLVTAVLKLYFDDFEHECDGHELCGHRLCQECGCVVQKMIYARAAAR